MKPLCALAAFLLGCSAAAQYKVDPPAEELTASYAVVNEISGRTYDGVSVETTLRRGVSVSAATVATDSASATVTKKQNIDSVLLEGEVAYSIYREESWRLTSIQFGKSLVYLRHFFELDLRANLGLDYYVQSVTRAYKLSGQTVDLIPSFDTDRDFFASLALRLKWSFLQGEYELKGTTRGTVQQVGKMGIFF
ncbi:hypothetical protein HYX14_05535 [Candidatus Woesearchaeota archaeon]|nr:hypothetical protein [Candidatus Woesearchaeota archaeon]